MSAKQITFDKALAIYLEDCESRGETPRTVEGKACNLRAFIRWCKCGELKYCAQLDQSKLELYRSYVSLYIDPVRKKKLDITTQRNRLTAVKVFLRRLQYHQIIRDNPAAFFELPSVQQRIPKAVLTEAEIELILNHVMLYGDKGIRDRAILETFYATGIRRMELGRLVIPDVDIDSR